MPEIINQDHEHLRLLSIFHYVYAGITAFFSSIGLIYVGIGLMFVFAGDKMGGGPQSPPPPAFVGLFFAIIGIVIVLFGWAHALVVFFAGRFLKRQTHYVFCFVIAVLNCVFVPFGTALGVCSLLVLNRPSVKALFEAAPVPAQTA